MKKANLLTPATAALLFIAAGYALPAKAQFSINETFKDNTVSSGISLGGSAYLTSGVSDPQGEGWLRLTESVNNQAGFAVINEAFPSNMGVLIDFEYTTWSLPGSGSGADGLSVFLFDAAYSDSFHIGGYGGSLGYARHSSQQGLSGGYMALGLDEFGNFSNPTENRNGGPGFTKNAVVLRGPAPDYAYLSGNQVIGSDTGSGDNGGIDYNTTTSTRPSPAQFYRRVQVSLEPTEGTYTITVKWKKSPADPFITLFGPVTMTQAPPAMLQLGLAASTGSQHNYHEIRNMVITTPGNISVVKQGPAYITNSSNPVSLSYDITVKNQTPVTVENIEVADLLPPGYTLTPADVSLELYGNSSNAVNNITVDNGILSGMATIAANSEVTLHVNGSISNLQDGQSIRNTVRVHTASIADIDTTNNVDTVYTIVQAPLPVRMTYFDVLRRGEDVLLQWATSSEINNERFEIEKSTDGKEFTIAGTVKGNGTTAHTSNYAFTDQNGASGTGTVYYRLRQVDADGQSEYSLIRSLQLQPGSAALLQPYPVPFTNRLNIQIRQTTAGKASISLYNTSGIKVCQAYADVAAGYNDINLPGAGSLPAGVYWLEYRSGSEKATLRIMKQ